MIRSKLLSLACRTALAGGSLLIGCKSSSSTPPPDTSPPPTTQAMTPAVTPASQPSVTIGNQGKIPAPPVALEKPPAGSMTHVLTKDEPFYESMPGPDAKSLGTLKSGTKVLLMVPGSTYSKVLTEDGASVYTMTDGIDPITAKK